MTQSFPELARQRAFSRFLFLTLSLHCCPISTCWKSLRHCELCLQRGRVCISQNQSERSVQLKAGGHVHPSSSWVVLPLCSKIGFRFLPLPQPITGEGQTEGRVTLRAPQVNRFGEALSVRSLKCDTV